jgi:hypothetical protein
LGPRDGLPVQGGDRRIEGLQDGQCSDIDAADRRADGVAPQMIDQRFDLGKFGHSFSLPV